MLTIEHCEALHVHFAQPESILSAAIRAGIAQAVASEAKGGVQTFATLHEAPPALGEIWPGQGGYYVGTMPARAGKPGYHLVRAKDECAGLKWGPYNHTVAGADDHWDGQANTNAILESSGGDGKFPAATWTYGIEVDDHDDFYLPSHHELMLMRICAPELFATSSYYWSSTQCSPGYAWVQDFEYGDSDIDGKLIELRAVAVRRLAL